ncbi:fimbrial protein [Providencia hangzhouensis]|uniref:fimbrial protein n=1 Tax=Providencia hangzhouensis TaxID=3031799 RepID=UPI0034DD14B7
MNKTLIALCLALTTTSISAMAADAGSGKITFKGTINSGACTIAPTDVNKEVQLGNIAAVNLDAAGKKGPLNSFELKLQDCQLDPSASGTPYSKVKITFNGQPDATNASLWSSTGSANNVAVSFLDSTGKTIKPGETLEQTLKALTPQLFCLLKQKQPVPPLQVASTLSQTTY